MRMNVIKNKKYFKNIEITSMEKKIMRDVFKIV